MRMTLTKTTLMSSTTTKTNSLALRKKSNLTRVKISSKTIEMMMGMLTILSVREKRLSSTQPKGRKAIRNTPRWTKFLKDPWMFWIRMIWNISSQQIKLKFWKQISPKDTLISAKAISEEASGKFSKWKIYSKRKICRLKPTGSFKGWKLRALLKITTMSSTARTE